MDAACLRSRHAEPKNDAQTWFHFNGRDHPLGFLHRHNLGVLWLLRFYAESLVVVHALSKVLAQTLDHQHARLHCAFGARWKPEAIRDSRLVEAEVGALLNAGEQPTGNAEVVVEEYLNVRHLPVHLVNPDCPLHFLRSIFYKSVRLGVFATDKIEDDRWPAPIVLPPGIAHFHNLEHAADADRLTLERLIGWGFLCLLHQLCHTLGLLLLVVTA